jgi:hypothetical protein
MQALLLGSKSSLSSAHRPYAHPLPKVLFSGGEALEETASSSLTIEDLVQLRPEWGRYALLRTIRVLNGASDPQRLVSREAD